jgi:hypothetical protein
MTQKLLDDICDKSLSSQKLNRLYLGTADILTLSFARQHEILDYNHHALLL